MSRLGELIRTLCPDGVEYKQIGELCDKVQRVSWEGDRKYEYIDLSSVDIKSHSIIQTTTIDKDSAPSRAQQIVRENDIIFGTTRPTLKRISYITKEYDGQVCSTGFCVIHTNSNFIMPKWVYYIMCDTRFNNYVKANEEGANYPCIADGKIRRYEIPVPPMEVQEEIVRILDKFTALEAELEAELEARKKQYEHYRDTLLDFTPPVDEKTLIFKRLGDVCEIRSGWGFPNKEQGIKEGDFPFYKVGDMNLQGNEHFMMSANNYISRETAKRLGCNPAPKGTTIFPKIGAAIATNKKRVLTVSSCYDNNVVGIVPGNEVIPEFIFYLFDSIDLMTFSDFSGAVPSIRKTTLEKHLIPIPPIEEQERIVGILDKFEAICTDLCEGLPAEIEARRRQYEHYRDKLLSFKRI